jgi:hypothetical protein
MCYGVKKRSVQVHRSEEGEGSRRATADHEETDGRLDPAQKNASLQDFLVE